MGKTLRVGATGHQDIRPEDAEYLRVCVRGQLKALLQELGDDHGFLELRVGDAPGADAMVLDEALRLAESEPRLRIRFYRTVEEVCVADLVKAAVSLGYHRGEQQTLAQRVREIALSAGPRADAPGSAGLSRARREIVTGISRKADENAFRVARSVADAAREKAGNAGASAASADRVRKEVFEATLLQEMAPENRQRRAAEVLGRLLAYESDCLIALWDGVDTGLEGGTSWVVQQARRRLRPRRAGIRILHLVTPRVSNPYPVGVPGAWRASTIASQRKQDRLRGVWGYVAPAAVLTIVSLGWYGFWALGPAGQPGLRRAFDSLIRALGLPIAQTVVIDAPAVPLMLHIARFLGALAPFAAGVAVLAALSDSFRGARVRYYLWRPSGPHPKRKQVPQPDCDQRGTAQRENGGYAVVLGLGWVGEEIVRDLLQHGRPVVAVDINPGSPGAIQCRADGAVIFTGDASSQSLLSDLRLQEASEVYVAAGSDEMNLRIVNAVAACVEEHRAGSINTARADRWWRARLPGTLKIYVHLADAHLRDLAALITKQKLPVDVRGYDVPDMVARSALSDYPLDRFIRAPGLPAELACRPAATHVVVVGDHPVAEALLLHSLQLGYFCESQLQIHMMVPDPAAFSHRLFKRYPPLRPLAPLRELLPQVHVHPLPDAPSELLGRESPLFVPIAEGAIITTFLCVDDGLKSAAFAGTLGPAIERECMEADGKRRICDYQLLYYYSYPGVHDRTVVEAGLNALSRTLPVLSFGSTAITCGGIVQDEIERLAMGVHQFWAERGSASDMAAMREPLDPLSEHEWLKQDEDDRASSRHSAAHIAVKLRQAGVLLEPAANANSLHEENSSIWEPRYSRYGEDLAKLEHRRWNGDQLLRGFRQNEAERAGDPDGYRWASKEGADRAWRNRLKGRREHLLIVPYDDLNDAREKSIDRKITAGLAAIVSSAGLRMVPAPTQRLQGDTTT